MRSVIAGKWNLERLDCEDSDCNFLVCHHCWFKIKVLKLNNSYVFVFIFHSLVKKITELPITCEHNRYFTGFETVLNDK